MARDPKREKKVREQERRRSARAQEQKQKLGVQPGEDEDPVAAPATKEMPKLPPRTVMERAMQQMHGGPMFGRMDNRQKAQELAYDAMEAEDEKTAGRLALQALRFDPDCTDALHLLAELSSRSLNEFIDSLRKTVQSAERKLGKCFFEENRGYFWGLLETRPYMRARASLADALVECGELDEAVRHYEDLLDLNPNDNQGLRDILLGFYFQQEDLAGVRRLLKQYEEDCSAVFAWARVLERFLSGEELEARKELEEARKANHFVVDYLTGRKRIPSESPGYYSPGQDSEAVVCMECLGHAWIQHRAAVAWLRQVVPAR